MADKDNKPTTSTTITPSMIEAEAQSFAMRAGSVVLEVMAKSNISEDQMAKMLDVSKDYIRPHIQGDIWRAYLPLAALCLALGIRVDLHTISS